MCFYVVVVVVMFCRGRIRWFKKVLLVILCYTSNIKPQTDCMSTGLMLQGRDQDRKLRINLLYSTMGVLGVFKRALRWFKTFLVVILCCLSNIKLQTARISTGLMLQGRDQDRKLRINLLYSTMGGLGGV